jgi:recombination protein RecA
VPFCIHGNVMNMKGSAGPLIGNLPHDGCVEVACMIDGNGINPLVYGDLPRQMAAVCRSNMSMFDLGAQAAIEKSKDLAAMALMLDPLTSAVCTPAQIGEMTGKLFNGAEAVSEAGISDSSHGTCAGLTPDSPIPAASPGHGPGTPALRDSASTKQEGHDSKPEQNSNFCLTAADGSVSLHAPNNWTNRRSAIMVATITPQTPTVKRNTSDKGNAMAKTAAKPEADGRAAAVERAVTQIERAFGKGSIMKLNDDPSNIPPGISTGAISLDLALGGRGIPRGRVCEFFGPESSGKTTLALHVVAHAQKAGGMAAFIDAEHALDPSWARRLGVNLEDLLVSQPDTGEQGLEICEMLVRSNAVDVVVVDSVAALIPQAEIDGEMGDSHVGLQARLMSQALRKLTGAIHKSRCTVIFINQLREKIGVMFGNPETTPGGRALKFYSSIRLDIRRTSSIKEGDTAVGNRVRARVVKNKVAPPFRTAEFDIMFNEGISAAGDLLDLAVTAEVVDKSGAWFSFGDTRLGQGRENSKQFLKDNPDLFEEIKLKVFEAQGINPSLIASAAEDDSPASSDD